MRYMRNLLSVLTLGASALVLTGCPGQGTFEIWVVNLSGEITMTNLTVVDAEDPAQFEEFPEDLPPETARVITDILAAPYEGGQVTLEILGQTGGEVLDDVDDTITVPDTIQDGTVLVIVLTGSNVLNFEAHYIPLDAASKGMLMLRKQLHDAALATS